MNTPTTFSITIPKPCHEDWNKMTPDAKGAFCSSCQKSVIDFSGKTDAEVSDILIANQEKKICGRFDAKQLDRPVDVSVPLYNIPANMSPARAFAMALFLVFGSFLFNCSTASGQKMGKIKWVETETVVPEKEEPKTEVVGQTTLIPENIKVLGGPSVKQIIPDTTKKIQPKTTKTIPRPEPEFFTMGDVKCETPVKGEVKLQTPVVKDSIKPQTNVPKDPLNTDPVEVKEILMGKPSFHPMIEDPIVIVKIPVMIPVTIEPKETAPADTMTVQLPQNTIEPVANLKVDPILPEKKPLSIEVLPNPSKGQLNLRYSLKEKNVTVIELYDLGGTRVKTFVNSQFIYEGTYTTYFDISDLPDGIYICTLRSGDKTASTKVILTK
jgi:hypothetical protein